MMSVLQYARRAHPKKLIHLASDEIFGPASDGVAHTEKDRFNPSSPYSASKAAQTCYAMSWWRTYQTPVMTVCPANMFAERQSPEKFLPLCISKIVKGEIIKIHGLAGRIGRRTYMHARNISDAILFLLNNVEPSKYNPLSEETQSMEMFNIFGKDEFSNLEIAQKIAKIIDKPLKYELVSFQEVRPGHDFLYRCNDDKIRNLGWREPVAFEESLERMVKWTIRPENSIWLK